MDKLFVLPSKFEDKQVSAASFFCPDCALIIGYLAYFPEVAKCIELTEVGFSKPRTEVVGILGEEYQGCPVLVLDAPQLASFPENAIHELAGVYFINDPIAITRYLSAKHNVSIPH